MTYESAPLTFSQATRLVAGREIHQRARDKSFLVSLGITLAVIVGIIVISAMSDSETTYDVGVTPESGLSAASLEQQGTDLGVTVKVTGVSADRASRAVSEGKLDAVVTGPGRVLVDKELEGDLAPVLDQANRQSVGAARLRTEGIDPARVTTAFAVPALDVTALDPPDTNADERGNIAFIGTILLYGQLLGYAMWVAFGIVEEKSSRVVEILLSTVTPRALLAGKVLGIGILGLAQLLVIAAVGVGVALAFDAVDATSNALVPVALVLGWFVLGYAFYSTAYAAAAARVSRQEDLQTVTTPMTLVIVASFFGAIWAANNSDNPLARVLGVLPPFSALVSPQRVAAGRADAWEMPVAIVLMLLAISALVVLGARMYERAVLHSGSVLSWRAAWKSDRVS